MRASSLAVFACVLRQAAAAALMARGSLKETPKASEFAADSTIPVLQLQSAAASASDEAAFYPLSQDNQGTKSTIYKDWSTFSKGSAFMWIADMDVDCDGLDYGCKGNPDGLPKTNWGALSAYHVPFIVVPDDFMVVNQHDLPENNVAAVICNGKMYYGILGDSNGDTPLVTGEASWLMARTCFPDDNLDGNKGHSDPDVIYIVFTGKDAVLPSSAINQNYITNFGTLRSMGNKLASDLVSSLALSEGNSSTSSVTSGTSSTTTSTSKAPPTPTDATCSDCEGSQESSSSSLSPPSLTSLLPTSSSLANVGNCFKEPSALMVTAVLMGWFASMELAPLVMPMATMVMRTMKVAKE
ncbi:hypothetical protein P170DRAFT_513354 [Aspergillus steynii IBT 23096]|uniref:Endo-chitosanase n=1 Tax=Aspergillus steynii IBT 23096 TaxID=1392250 RepID=A0A2I2FXG2_9EURO|nr:uncharacterized protein P170DRAFT_513354 [Aspergillus steynii IBT 23096]PLB45331.1 hypothetical protein P170DRAFT_513354 [Aspergillus steynii IBT 23096]